ncbi:MAG: Transketolase, C-terminal section [Brockia lithotrophica]|uniref:Transketolase, C-terminal section n=1 Tax=Brockia lithotrophica TaxID=933949 RepID=A0A2T5GB53_9BACL|nr:transketolase family protein [Brockia lithotrophica]PTQ53414.1 MAG: Transketolase, C-terminal section [Brockia lithotrophica]
MSRGSASVHGFAEAVVGLAQTYSNLILLDADRAAHSFLVPFRELYPDRLINVGVAEATMVGMAAGLATTGFIPVAITLAAHASQRAFPFIAQTIAIPRLNAKIVGLEGSALGNDAGAPRQALFDLAVMRVLPHMTVVVPADAHEAYRAAQALVAYDGPAYLRLSSWDVPPVTDRSEDFVIGRWKLLREGSDLLLVAAGPLVHTALEVAKRLAGESIEATVLNASTLKPLDERSLAEWACRTGVVVTLEDHTTVGGLGGAVAEFLSRECPIPLLRLGAPETPETAQEGGLDPDRVAESAREFLERRRDGDLSGR